MALRARRIAGCNRLKAVVGMGEAVGGGAESRDPPPVLTAARFRLDDAVATPIAARRPGHPSRAAFIRSAPLHPFSFCFFRFAASLSMDAKRKPMARPEARPAKRVKLPVRSESQHGTRSAQARAAPGARACRRRRSGAEPWAAPSCCVAGLQPRAPLHDGRLCLCPSFSLLVVFWCFRHRPGAALRFCLRTPPRTMLPRRHRRRRRRHERSRCHSYLEQDLLT